MSEFCEHETFKDICGICHRDTQITALRAEVERLSENLETLHTALTTARADALEEAARVADKHAAYWAGYKIAAAIRELKEKP